MPTRSPRTALRRLTRGLAATKADPAALDAREDSQFGMWLAMSGVGSGRGMGPSHAIGHTLGGTYGIPHGTPPASRCRPVLKWSEGYADERLALVSD
jgi:maleylacetate reductase